MCLRTSLLRAVASSGLVELAAQQEEVALASPTEAWSQRMERAPTCWTSAQSTLAFVPSSVLPTSHSWSPRGLIVGRKGYSSHYLRGELILRFCPRI